MNPRDHHISLNSRSFAIRAAERFASLAVEAGFFFFRQLVVTSVTTIKNEHHDDDVGRMNGQTDVGLHSEKDREAGGNGGKGRKEENVPELKRVRENEQKHIREYGRADELPPGRFHRSRCYPRRMTVRAGGRAIREEGQGG